MSSLAHNAFASSGPYSYAPINASSSGANTVIAATPGRSIVILGYVFMVNGDVTVTFESSGGSLLTGPMPAKSGGGASVAVTTAGHFRTLPGEGLVINLGGAVQTSGHVVYTTVAA